MKNQLSEEEANNIIGSVEQLYKIKLSEEQLQAMRSFPQLNVIDWKNHEDFLMAACLLGHTEAINKLIQLGVDVNVNTLSEGKVTPIIYSLMHTALYMSEQYSFNVGTKNTEMLIKANANIEAQDKDGWTPLMWACSKGGLKDHVKLLLSYGAKTDVVSKKDKTALDPNEIYPIKEGETALDLAENSEIISMLKAMPDIRNNVKTIIELGNAENLKKLDKNSQEICEKMLKLQLGEKLPQMSSEELADFYDSHDIKYDSKQTITFAPYIEKLNAEYKNFSHVFTDVVSQLIVNEIIAVGEVPVSFEETQVLLNEEINVEREVGGEGSESEEF